MSKAPTLPSFTHSFICSLIHLITHTYSKSSQLFSFSFFLYFFVTLRNQNFLSILSSFSFMTLCFSFSDSGIHGPFVLSLMINYGFYGPCGCPYPLHMIPFAPFLPCPSLSSCTSYAPQEEAGTLYKISKQT